MEHPVSKGYFCNLKLGRDILPDDVERIKDKMREIIKADIPFKRTECHTTEAVRIFNEKGMDDKVRLLETSDSIYTYYYTLGDTVDYYYGNLVPRTSYIQLFDLVEYYDGLLLRIPNKDNPNELEKVIKQEKMLDVFKEYLQWSKIMDMNNAGDLILHEKGYATDMINVAKLFKKRK